ncbi:MAG: hypothetical protein WDO73_14595 [Ignavibacteriota bacterium]
MLDTRQPSAVELIAVLPSHHIGSAPLGYLTQQRRCGSPDIRCEVARLTAAIFGAAAVGTTLLLGAELGLSGSWMGARCCLRYSR